MSAGKPRLTGDLSLTSVVLFGLAYISPGIVVTTFGVIAATSGGAAPTAYAVATVAILLTGLSYAKMARVVPGAGSVYSYARAMLGRRIGFLAGWAMLLDYFFIPMVGWLIQATYCEAQFPAVPRWVWLVLVVALTTGVNAFGMKLADRVNKVLMTVAIGSLALFAVLCVVYLGHHDTGPVTGAVWNSQSSVGAITAAAAVAAYSFLGFDAISTLGEETKDSTKTVSRGVIACVVAAGAIFLVLSFILQLVHPGGRFADEDAAAFAIKIMVGGRTYADIVNFISVAGGVASCIALQASTARLMYVMGRDGVLPRRVFGRLSPKLGTPVTGLLLTAAAGVIAMGLDLATATSFINFGAFLGFTLVNVSVVAWSIRERKEGRRHNLFTFIVLPLAGAAVSGYLLSRLGGTALVIGLVWLALGILYLAVLTRGFRRPPPELSAVGREPVPAPEDPPRTTAAA
ncbi:APC family permease [Amycolatopsis sp. PS_44_ISF1]|uniref:APC family permease n=1 Tax=Amycolatopsis sp. PS_44_ISF1 TaxID=2974917 RepID=UPI0028DD4B6E|nr:APC family permease [Amycolatopsis sp. PS_44_ISF1]MDT8912299.1 APC family permease [Amycolatopsis sp. PS_44_ISF1]